MLRKLFAYSIFAMFCLWIMLMMAQPILRYFSVDRHVLGLTSQVAGYIWISIIVLGAISGALLLPGT